MTQPCFLFAYFDFLIQVISVDILLALHDVLVYCKRDTNTLKTNKITGENYKYLYGRHLTINQYLKELSLCPQTLNF